MMWLTRHLFERKAK